jgi:hypothetical protein
MLLIEVIEPQASIKGLNAESSLIALSCRFLTNFQCFLIDKKVVMMARGVSLSVLIVINQPRATCFLVLARTLMISCRPECLC